MREYKFRGKRIDTGEWVYGYYYNSWGKLTSDKKALHYIINMHEGDSALETDVVRPETIGQYTGLKDQDGIEIYEGDKVKIQLPLGGFWGDVKNEKIGVCRFEEDYGSYIIEWEYSKNQHHTDLNCDISFTSEVIGNIYWAENVSNV